LWERIKHKTRYAVRIDSGKLVREVVADLEKVEIRRARVAVAKAEVQVVGEREFQATPMTAIHTAMFLPGHYVLPNLVNVMSDLLEHTTPPVRLTRRTLLALLKQTKRQTAAVQNPHEFAAVSVRLIRERLADQLVDGILYQKIPGGWYEMSQFMAEIQDWEDYLIPAEHSLYDQVAWDSEVERAFAKDLDARPDVKMFLKLPAWFTVPTPVGDYNPDWAIVMENRDAHGVQKGKDLLYLVRETKDEKWPDSARPDERRKVLCGEAHFAHALGVDYRVVSKAKQL
jgi:type III restriction enzyme